jgi:hypothetical protein
VPAADIVQKAVEGVQFKALPKQVTIKVNAYDNLPLVNDELEKRAWVLNNFLAYLQNIHRRRVL